MSTLAITNCLHCGSQFRAVNNRSSYCCDACEFLHKQSFDNSFSLHPEYIYLDQPHFHQLYEHNKSEYNYQLYVEGLHCSSCVHLLEKLPDYDEQIIEARVDYARSRLALKTSKEFSLAQAATLLKNWGYDPKFLKPEESNEASLLKENRNSIKKIAVAGACAGNIMLFVIPVYAGLAGTWQVVFNWLSFVLFLPIVFYSALSFYKGAWNSLRYQSINVDLPITIALWSGFLLSTVNLLRGDGPIYYDSTASFIFLILCARYLLKRVQQNFLSSYHIQDFIEADCFLTLQNEQWVETSMNSLVVGDLLKLQRGQNSPVDATVESQEALIDLSILNGESMPRRFHRGLEILAGSKIVSPEVIVKVSKVAKDSRLAGLLRELEENSYHKADFVTLTDRLAQKLIITVFAIAVLFFIFYFQINLQEAFNRSLALIVLACPCALAFGSPLTLGLALKKAQQKGILIKNSNAFEKILKITNIFFDKTGTLTDLDLQFVAAEPEIISSEIKTIIMSLEQKSYHPVAFAIRKMWSDVQPHAVSNLQEKLGQGVSGHIDNQFYELKTLNETIHENALGLVLLKNGQAMCRLYFEDPLRADSKKCLEYLKNKKFATFLISGDRKERVLRTAKQCGIQSDHAFAELFPEDKKAILQKYKNTCMIGDGANDALSLQSADIGIAVKGSMSLSLQAADIYFTRGGLQPFIDLLQLAENAQKILIRNLSLSLAYNIIGGVLALSGFINPMVAAILMPISSVIIIISTLWGLR